MDAVAMLGNKILKEALEKSYDSAAHRRELATQVVARQGCSQRQACRFFGLHRATYRYRHKFNLFRPHRSLKMKTPAEYAALHQPSGSPGVRTAAS